jgi:hypothetical protein
MYRVFQCFPWHKQSVGLGPERTYATATTSTLPSLRMTFTPTLFG